MARIPDAEIERLKSEIAVERLAEAAGVALRRHGADLIGLCPFHDDHEPSLVITPAKNLWHCLGACAAGGSVIDWVMRAEGVSFRHAVEILREERFSPLAAPGRKPPKTSTVRRLSAPIDAEAADDSALLSQVADYYHETLLASPEALSYLERRGIGDPSLIEDFRIGYANRTLCYRLPEKNRKAGAVIRGRLQELGVMRSSGHEHFNGSVTIPLLDADGAVVQIYGRKVTRNLRPGTPDHLYLPGPHGGVFNRAGIEGASEAILCESLIDALSFIAAGIDNTTAAYGTNGMTDEIYALLAKAERVLIAYDADDAGNGAAEALSARLAASGTETYRIHFPWGMDANEYACQVRPAKESLPIALRKAAWTGRGKGPERGEPSGEPTDEVTHRFDPGSPAPRPAPDPLPPSPAPQTPPNLEAEISEKEVTINFGERHWRIRGLEANLSYQILKVNLLVSEGEGFHVDNLDLYSGRARANFETHAARELRTKPEQIRRELGRVLLKCEELQDLAIQAALVPEKVKAPEPAGREREAALDFLRDPEILGRIAADFVTLGVVGEAENKILGYLAAISRRLDDPLAVVIQSSSAAGKSSLQDAILSLVPDEEKVTYSAMTAQSLFYMGEADLSHKVLAIAEDEGAERAKYPLKILQSEGELRIATVTKDPETGRHLTQSHTVKGPAAVFFTTTAPEIDDELASRCLVLGVDESRDQTASIHQAQRRAETLSGLTDKVRRKSTITLHHNAARLLREVHVVNPYAEALSFPTEATRARRDHAKYLALIRAIAYLRQHQKAEHQTEIGGEAVSYIEVDEADVEAANLLAHAALGRSLDELAPQTRRLLTLITQMVESACETEGIAREEFRFSRRDIRCHTAFSDFQVRIHLERLVEMEYVARYSTPRAHSYQYELLFDGEADSSAPHFSGLIDAKTLVPSRYDGRSEGQRRQSEPHLRPICGASVGEVRSPKTPPLPGDSGDAGDRGEESASPERDGPGGSQQHLLSATGS